MSSETTTLYLSGQTNSTLFTRCCGMAVSEWAERCPKCGKDIAMKTGSRLRNLLRGDS